MDDWVKSSVGGEKTDQSFSGKPLNPSWVYQPLPLSQVSPDCSSLPGPPGHLRSLQSCCLSSISSNVHLFSPESFSTLPTTLKRKILHRVISDRGYDFRPTPRDTDTETDESIVEDDGPSHDARPDAATLWSYSVTVDPELHLPNAQIHNLSTDHILSTRIDNLLADISRAGHTQSHQHPLIEVPKMFRFLSRGHFSLLTTLHIDGVQAKMDDSTLQHLRWCPHLTLLWTKNCDISDYGLRLLASSLELSKETDRGPRRLRGWFMQGCRKVSDAALKTLARWPGLVVLDVRDTSCTSASRQIVNTQYRRFFPQHARDFQPCTPGLKAIFSSRSDPAQILDALCSTLVKPSVTDPSSCSRWWLGLHVVSSSQPLRPEWLPDPRVDEHVPTASSSQSRTYRGDGIGQIYGKHVYHVEDKAQTYRANLQTAMRLQYEDEGLSKREKPWWEVLAGAKRKSKWEQWDDKKKPQKLLKGFKMPKGGRAWDEASRVAIARGQIPGGLAANSDDKSRAFVTGNGSATWKRDHDPELIEGDEALMLVRMVDDSWESLEWTKARVSSVAGPSTPALRTKRMEADSSIVYTGSQVSSGPPSAQPLRTGFFAPSQSQSPRISCSQMPTQYSSAGAVNPFRKAPKDHPGIRPMTEARKFTDYTVQLMSSSDLSSDPIGPLSSSPPNIKLDPDDLSFGNAPVKRCFGGANSLDEPKKRRGMKMFSGRVV
ncbi:hypothetical protein BD324DRAFT_649291 [Kockovaella imperatae]|uniref:Uncharacterized protein n=1 Tax=Kockovaella imperatae TaxID=4999 RepID=A0A1Y1UMI9_9TREE|nr:hypothetical protein BD324DRAFT_649291 [Kockovaella imperatae]ORX39202.1 hypothetical protein BD324DRAFT_649291 [Kockovaella imperatae]